MTRPAPTAPDCLDLFAGGGGMACAMREEGLAARHVELDASACATLRTAGFGDVYEGDVRALDAYAPATPVRLLHGSPPCPRWSQATRHAHRIVAAVDGWPWMLAAVDRTAPELVTVECVKGAPVAAWAADLEARGYFVAVWRLDAADYGAPQTRTRAVLVASRHAMPVKPRPTHGFGAALPARTLGECLDADLAGQVVYPAGLGTAASEPWRLERPAPTVTCQEVKGTRANARAAWTFNGGPDRASDAVFRATGRRRITVAESARLQTFPERWPFAGTVDAQYRQSGNAVPPVLGRVMLRAALATLPSRQPLAEGAARE